MIGPLVIKSNSLLQKLRRIKDIIRPPITVEPIGDDIIIMRNVRVPMRDGITLSVNVYRPRGEKAAPALLNLHPYNKDNLPRGGHLPFQYRVIRQTSHITFSEETSWEAPDPKFWVHQGYIIVSADKRGFGKSDGSQGMMNDAEAQDYYDLIEWVAAQPWCSGKVGLLGVSYLAISQYKVAALNPPHLFAICPWEGLSDAYKDAFRPGGIREDGFILLWSRGLKKQPGPSFRQLQIEHSLRDQFYLSMVPDLEKIQVPALICGSFSDQLLHTRGSFRVFDKIASKHKWLYTHRSGKWATFYSAEAKELQLRFFDFFLKGISNNMLETPPVRVEVREFGDQISRVFYAQNWPIENLQWKTLYLDNASFTLQSKVSGSLQEVTINLSNQSLFYDYVFPKDTEVIGPMRLDLYLRLENSDDANLFVGVQKIHNGQEVSFEGSYGFQNDIVTKGFMRVSLRKINSEKSTPFYPEHDFDACQPPNPNELAHLEISLLPSATFFRKGDVLRLVIQGQSLLKYGKLDQVGNYEKNRLGINAILQSTNSHPSRLVLPTL